jgi:hypothetical protein
VHILPGIWLPVTRIESPRRLKEDVRQNQVRFYCLHARNQDSRHCSTQLFWIHHAYQPHTHMTTHIYIYILISDLTWIKHLCVYIYIYANLSYIMEISQLTVQYKNILGCLSRELTWNHEINYW